MWAVHLARAEWRAALRAARSQAQRNAVNAAAAEAAMAAGDARRAAELWGKVRPHERLTCMRGRWCRPQQCTTLRSFKHA
jgi:sRNA-binding protein